VQEENVNEQTRSRKSNRRKFKVYFWICLEALQLSGGRGGFVSGDCVEGL
jgi:hypothetical protein